MNFAGENYTYIGFPGSSAVKNPPAMQEEQETWVRSLCQKDPLKKQMTTHSTTLAWKSRGQRSLASYSMESQELDMT